MGWTIWENDWTVQERRYPVSSFKIKFAGLLSAKEDPTDIESKDFRSEKSIYKDARKWHGKDGVIDILHPKIQFKAQQ